MALALLAGCAPAAGSGRIEPEFREPLRRRPLTTLDLIRMTEAGLEETSILDRLAVDGVAVRPTPRALDDLRAAGVSDRIVAAVETAEVYPRDVHAPPPNDDVQPWWFATPSWQDDFGRTLHVR